jgi:hypothetical protein
MDFYSLAMSLISAGFTILAIISHVNKHYASQKTLIEVFKPTNYKYSQYLKDAPKKKVVRIKKATEKEVRKFLENHLEQFSSEQARFEHYRQYTHYANAYESRDKLLNSYVTELLIKVKGWSKNGIE